MQSHADRAYLFPWIIAHVLGDVCGVAVAWVLAFVIRFRLMPGGQSNQERDFALLGVVAVVVTLFFLQRNRLFDIDVTMTWRKQTGKLFKTASEVFFTFTTLYYFVFVNKVSRLNLVIAYVLLFFMLVTERTLVDALFACSYRNGRYVRRVLLVGHGPRMAELMTEVWHSPGLRLVGQWRGGDHLLSCPKVEGNDLHEVVEHSGADMVIISFPLEELKEENEVVAQGLDLLQTRVYLLPHIPGSYAGTVLKDFHHLPALQLNAAEMTPMQRMEKRAFDLATCVPAVILLSPLFLLIALLVKCTSKGPVLFRQERVTRDGKVFTMLKFRSMRTDMPETGGAHWTEENDPRVTKVGRILRRTSLDELPQFFNVIGGSMSLIGPRPERPVLVERFKREIPGYDMRHRMKAGITGWAQVNGLRGNTSLTKRLDFDLYYIRNWSLWFDVKIFFMTFFKGFVNKNAY